jgi:hypothetical protein
MASAWFSEGASGRWVDDLDLDQPTAGGFDVMGVGFLAIPRPFSPFA